MYNVLVLSAVSHTKYLVLGNSEPCPADLTMTFVLSIRCYRTSELGSILLGRGHI